MACWYTDQDILNAIGEHGPHQTYVVVNRIKRPGMVVPKTANVRHRLRRLAARGLVIEERSRFNSALLWRLPSLVASPRTPKTEESAS